jgi:hypothetical protein
MNRRELLTGGALSGLIGSGRLPASAAAAAQAPPTSERALQRVAEAINELRDELREERQFTEIGAIRAAQKQYLRSNGRLPDFMDVGADVWFQAYDWHVRWQQPIEQARDGQGRLTLALNQTLLVLRADLQATYIGLPYDAR